MTLFVVPENPGTSITFIGERTVRPPASIADTVALIITHDWGPLRTPKVLNSFAEFESLFGNSDTDGRDAVLGAFVGNGVPSDLCAAGSVVVYRAGDDTAAKATLTLAKATTGAGVVLTALHEGTRGNDIDIVVETDPADAARDRVRILLDDVTVEKYAYTAADTATLVAAINARPSKYVSAELTSAAALAHISATPLTGGADGTPLTADEYQAGLDALEYESYSVLGAANLTDSGIQVTLQSWVDTQADEMRPVETVFGGPADETYAETITRVDGERSYHVVALGSGTFHDDYLDKDVGTAKLVGRVAGALAGGGEHRALTYLPFAGLSLVDPVEITTDVLRGAADAGITVFRRASVPDADLVISRGVTTFNSVLDATHPVEIFGDPRLVRVIDLFLRRVKTKGDATIIGLPNNETTRTAVLDIGKTELAYLVDQGLIVNTAADAPFFNVPDPDPYQPDMIGFEFGWRFAYTTNYLVGVGRVR